MDTIQIIVAVALSLCLILSIGVLAYITVRDYPDFDNKDDDIIRDKMIEIIKKPKYRVECSTCGTVYTHEAEDFIDLLATNLLTKCKEICKGTKCPACGDYNGHWSSMEIIEE